MSYCQSTRDGEHRWEYTSSGEGGDYYRCLNAGCGETMHQLIDGIGGFVIPEFFLVPIIAISCFLLLLLAIPWIGYAMANYDAWVGRLLHG